jgi:hypothetical protein
MVGSGTETGSFKILYHERRKEFGKIIVLPILKQMDEAYQRLSIGCNTYELIVRKCFIFAPSAYARSFPAERPAAVATAGRVKKGYFFTAGPTEIAGRYFFFTDKAEPGQEDVF